MSDTAKFLQRVLFAPAVPTDSFLNSTTVATFTTVYNATQSTRALGWDTNGANGPCGSMSATAFTHTGATGQCVGPAVSLAERLSESSLLVGV